MAAALAFIPKEANIVRSAVADSPSVAIREARAGCGLRLIIVSPNFRHRGRHQSLETDLDLDFHLDFPSNHLMKVLHHSASHRPLFHLRC